MGEFGSLVSLPDGTLHSPHHKRISRGLTELPAPSPTPTPSPLSEAQKCPYDPLLSPKTLFHSHLQAGNVLAKGFGLRGGGGGEINSINERKSKASKGNMEEMKLGVAWRGAVLLHQSWHRCLCSCPQSTQTQLVLPHIPVTAFHLSCSILLVLTSQ